MCSIELAKREVFSSAGLSLSSSSVKNVISSVASGEVVQPFSASPMSNQMESFSLRGWTIEEAKYVEDDGEVATISSSLRTFFGAN